MADTPQQDREAGLPRAEDKATGRRYTKYVPELAIQIVEQIAEGKTLAKICARGTGMPAPGTFRKWTATVPELAKAYQAARMLSAMAMEDQALDIARETLASPGTTQKLRAAELAISQLRWSAARRDPKQFSDKGVQNFVVPINIQTTLNLGEGEQQVDTIPDIYTLTLTPEEAPVATSDNPRLLAAPSRGPRKTVLTPRIPMDADIKTLKDEGKL